MKTLRSYCTGLMFMLFLCLCSTSIVGCKSTSKNLIETETIDVALNQVKSVTMEVLKKTDENNIDLDTDTQYDSISKISNYSNPFVIQGSKNTHFYLSENSQDEYREIQAMFNRSSNVDHTMAFIATSFSTLELETTTISAQNIDLETINEDYEIEFRDQAFFSIDSIGTYISKESVNIGSNATFNIGSMEETPEFSKERLLYKVELDSLVIDDDWFKVLEDYPSVLPIYEKENGDMYVLQKQTQGFGDSETSSENKYVLYLIASNGETQINDLNIVFPDNINKNSFLIDLPWIAYKHGNAENESSTSVLNLETNQRLSFETYGNIDSIYPIKDGVIVATDISVDDEDYKLGCRDYIFVDFDQKVTKLVPPEKYVTLYASSGSQNILWMDATCSYIYRQIPSSKKQAVLLTSEIKVKEILPTSDSSFWIIPYKSEIEANSEIFLLKEENKHLKFIKCNLPIDLSKETKEFFVDNDGFLIVSPDKGESSPSIYTISSKNYSLLTEYKLQLPEDVEKLQIKSFLTAIQNTRFFVCNFGKKLTGDTEIEVGRDRESGEILQIWISELSLKGIFRCTLP